MKRTYKNPCYECVVLSKCSRDIYTCKKWKRFMAIYGNNIIWLKTPDKHNFYSDLLHSPKLISITIEENRITFNMENESILID